MKLEKKTAEYTVLKRKDGRYAVQATNKKFIHAEEKVKILIAEGLLKAPEPKVEAEPEAPAKTEDKIESAPE